MGWISYHFHMEHGSLAVKACHWLGLALMLGVIGLAVWTAGLRLKHYLYTRYGGGSRETRRQWARRLADASFDGLLIHRNGTVLQMNRALVRMLGHRELELLGTHFSNLTHPASMPALRTELEAPQPEIAEFILLHADRSERIVEMASHTLEYDGMPATVTAIRNITVQRTLESRLAHLTHNDALTELPNRAQFSEKLRESLTRNDRVGGTTAVLTMEVDQLKAVNEQFGRAGGDSLLRQIAARLLTLAHDSDTVARLGGDTFGIVQPHTGAPNRTASLASKIETSFAEAFIVEGKAVIASMSIGIAIYPEHATDAEGLLRASSIAREQVSRAGGGASRIFSHADAGAVGASRGQSGGGISESQRLAQDLRQAIPRNEICLEYQPVFAAKFLNIAGYEALARWWHPKEGVIGPDKFIPLADEAGLSAALGNFILETACMEAVRCNSPLMAVNLSPLQFIDPQLPGCIADVLRNTGLPAERLELEVTESMLTGDPKLALEAFRAIRNLGVGVALDDFGAGFSNLTSLSDFPFNKIKIDRRFVQALGEDANAEAIIAAIILLARNLRIEVTAVGVETEAQLKYLQEKGCNFLQGYHLGRPAPMPSPTLASTLAHTPAPMPAPMPVSGSAPGPLAFSMVAPLPAKPVLVANQR